MKLILIQSKNDPVDAKAHWNLLLQNTDDVEKYFESFQKRQTNLLWDFLGDRDMQGKGNNPVGQLLTHHINSVPAGQNIHLGELCFQVDRFMNHKILAFHKLLNKGEEIRVSAGGGYCHASMFRIVDAIEIDVVVMRHYVHDKTARLEKMIEYLMRKPMCLDGQEIAVKKIHSITYAYPCLTFEADLSHEAPHLIHQFNIRLNQLRKNYFGIDTSLQIKPVRHVKAA
jgi:hypothetical protein